MLFIHFVNFHDLNDRLELLSKIRNPKLRGRGTNYLGQISYLLFYLSYEIAGIMPCHFTIEFTVTAHHVDSTWQPIPKAHLGSYAKAYWHPYIAHIQYYLWPISWKTFSLSWPTYELFTLWVSPVHGSAYSTVHSTLRAWVILRIESHLTSRVTPYGSG